MLKLTQREREKGLDPRVAVGWKQLKLAVGRWNSSNGFCICLKIAMTTLKSQ